MQAPDPNGSSGHSPMSIGSQVPPVPPAPRPLISHPQPAPIPMRPLFAGGEGPSISPAGHFSAVSSSGPPHAPQAMPPMSGKAGLMQAGLLSTAQGMPLSVSPHTSQLGTMLPSSSTASIGPIPVGPAAMGPMVGPPNLPPPPPHMQTQHQGLLSGSMSTSQTGLSSHQMTPYPNSHLPGFMQSGALSMPHITSQSHKPVQPVQPQMQSSASTTAVGQQQAQQFQRLKVEDALSYLDQVKLQFGNHPQVYNDFLDIMKEFKSQSIDTPGVISRVSNLFRGHPELIVGFNTFLPPGYKIEVQANDTISVQQPGQPSMSLSQLTGNREHNSQQPSYRGLQPVNLSVNPGGSQMDQPRNGLDSMVAAMTAGSQATNTPGQPVEFNHAINYVNKIKNRFQGQPDIYKNFLEILHTYQKEQKQIKDGLIAPNYKPLTETEVFSQVAKLFRNEEDLLKEFGQFLPDANGQGGIFGKAGLFDGLAADLPGPTKKQSFMGSKPTSKLSSGSGSLRKMSGSSSMPPLKKNKPNYNKDPCLADLGKYGSLNEYAFFDRVRKALRSQDVYENFLRCFVLFNQEVISRNELTQLIQPFLGKFPELFRRLNEMLGCKESGGLVEPVPAMALGGTPKAASERMMRDDLPMDIDYTSCKRYGHSYRGLPNSYHPPRCTGRTPLCREVLNDTLVSFPSWSEESTFVTSRKTQFEENIYRCEDERFELDMVIELNLATARVLEGVQKKLQRMNSEEAAKFKLDNSLGGSSEVIHRKAINRIYGDKSSDIIEGLKKNPVVAVPLVLRRLKAKDDEWREAQRQFNKIWREQNEKYYLKSLDHQGINFKQTDVKLIRSKSLINEIEAIYDTEVKARKDTRVDGTGDDSPVLAPTATLAESQPHLTLRYKDPNIIDECMALIIHHARRQASTQKEDKQQIKSLMKQNLQKFFHRAQYALSDDEEDDDNEERESVGTSSSRRRSPAADRQTPIKSKTNSTTTGAKSDSQLEQTEPASLEEDSYALFFTNTNWYLFMRLHQILADRLHAIKVECDRLSAEHARAKEEKTESTAIALRLKTPTELEPAQYFSHFLELIKQLLDGNIESGYYEDQLRELFGIHAYIAFTLDKVIQNIVKQLQYIVQDEQCQEVTDVWLKETGGGNCCGSEKTRADRSVAEATYQKVMESTLSEDNCFKITTYKLGGLLTISLLDTDQETSSVEVSSSEKWDAYIDKFAVGGGEEVSDEVRQHLKRTPIFLTRNLKQWKKYNHTMLEKPKNATEKSKQEDNEEPDSEDEATDREGADITEEFDALEGQECRFNINSFKMIYVVNSESYLYKRNAFTKAHKTHESVSKTMYKGWEKFCKAWRDVNVATAESKRVMDWLNGHNLEDCRPCQTECNKGNNTALAPYRPYNRYTVKYEKVTATTVASAPDDGNLAALTAADESMDTS